jgi:hypothetical protein
MSDTNQQEVYPLTIEIITKWLLSKEQETAKLGVTLADLRESQLHVPTVAADFDSQEAMGRVSVWASGEFDFLVLRIADGTDAFFRHETVEKLSTPALEGAFQAFLRSMVNPGKANQKSD